MCTAPLHGRTIEELSNEELEYYSRQIVLPPIGYDGQLRLRNAKVCIVGLGGLGSPAALQLASMGVGHLRLVDYDVVELSNLQRQHLYDIHSLGYAKVEVAAMRLRDLNPHVQIEPLPLFLSESNAQDIVRDMDVVVDGLDRMSPRYALNRACVNLGVPYIFGAAVSTYGNVSTIIPGTTACVECFQRGFDDDSLPTCAVVGVHPSIINIIASIEVSEAIRVLLGQKPRLANGLLHCDVEYLEFEKLDLSKADDCPVCGSELTAPAAIPEHRLVTELCARQGLRTFVIAPRRDLALDMSEVRSLLSKGGFDAKVEGELGITFDRKGNKTVSLLKSGVMIVEDAADEDEACDFYGELVFEGLHISPSAVEGVTS